MCRILDGRPRGRGRAEISIETIHHPEIAVGMKGILMASEATLEIIAVRPGVAKATLQGKGVEKLSYRGWMAVIEPDESFRATNANASQLTPTADGAAGRRLLGAK